MFFWWNDSLSSWHFPVYLWLYLSGSHTSFLILKFSKVQLFPSFFLPTYLCPFQWYLWGLRKWALRSVGPLRAGLDQDSIYQATPHVLTPLGATMMHPFWSITPCPFPTEPGAIYKGIHTGGEGNTWTSLGLQDLARMTLPTSLNSCGHLSLRHCPPA